MTKKVIILRVIGFVAACGSGLCTGVAFYLTHNVWLSVGIALSAFVWSSSWVFGRE